MPELRCIAGRDPVIGHRWAGNDLNRLQRLADELCGSTSM
jgi:hypothetical protein